jgi:hypothetical protein
VCTGEWIDFDVTFHELELTVVDNAGGTHYKLLIQGQRVVGIGQTTGDVYVGKNMYTETDYVSYNADTEVVTWVRPLHIVSKGSSDNRLRNITAHFTVNAGGELTVEFEDDRPMCVG